MRRVLVMLVGVLLLSLACSRVEQEADSGSMGTTAEGQGEEMATEHVRAQLHGGTAVMKNGHYFEVVCLADGVRVYAYDGDQRAVSLAGASGEVALQYSDPEPKLASMPLEYVDAPDVEIGNELLPAGDYLFAAVDLSAVSPGSLNMGFAVTGLGGDADSSAQFETSFEALVNRPYCCPMHADAWGETAESVCPICGGMKTSALRAAK